MMRNDLRMQHASRIETDPVFPEPERCWPRTDPLLTDFHDNEWGVPVHEDRKLFENLVMLGSERNRTWLDIIRMRGSYRRVLDDFNFEKIALYTGRRLDSLLLFSELFRTRRELETLAANAAAFIIVRVEFGSFDRYIWGFTGNEQVKGEHRSIFEIPLRTALSDEISEDLKARGFRRMGSKAVYSYLQAAGIVNDHLTGCFRNLSNPSSD